MFIILIVKLSLENKVCKQLVLYSIAKIITIPNYSINITIKRNTNMYWNVKKIVNDKLMTCCRFGSKIDVLNGAKLKDSKKNNERERTLNVRETPMWSCL